MSEVGSVEPRAVGHGTVPADQRKRAWRRRSCILPANNVGATRWAPRGYSACSTPASSYVGPPRTMAAGRSTAMESPLPGTGRDDRRREPSEVARRQNRPSPGAARRPLPARERRFFVASLGTDGSFLSASSTEQTLPAGNVGATRWVAHWVRRTQDRGAALRGTIAHDGGRATHRVAPTCRA
jgi:hypothetical protein